MHKFKQVLAALGCLLAFTAHANTGEMGEAKSWWDDSPWGQPDRGFNWYPDPREERREQKPPKAEEKPKTIFEMTKLEDVQKELARLKGEAVVNPTEKNVLAFLRAQNWVMDKASMFADVSRRVVWANPEVNYSARSSVVSFARDRDKTRTDNKRDQNLKSLAETHGILFFARSDCDYCHDQAPVLKAFSMKSGIPILTVSLDGRPISMFPDAKPDNGISVIASGGNGIQTVPAVYLIDRKTQKMTALGTGVIAGEELAERIRVLTMTKPGEEF